MSSGVAFGYRMELVGGVSTLVEDPAEQATIGRMRELHSLGYGSVRIAGTLNSEGYLCRGSRWHRTTVRRILKRLLGTAGVA